MLTSYSRVTVVSGTRRVDLALPSALPIADVLPQVLRFCAPDEAPEDPAEFTLARVGGQSLALSQSLGEAGVHDGDVIELRAFSAEGRAAFIEDVRDAIEDSVDGAGGAWSSRSTVTFAVVTTSAVLLLYLLARVAGTATAAMGGVLAPEFDTPEIVSAMVASVLLVGMSWVATVWGAPWSPYISTLVAALWAYLSGVEVASDQSDKLSVALVCGAAAAALVAGVSRLITARAMPLLTATVVLLVGPGAVLIAGALGAREDMAVRVLAALAVLSIGVMPRLSIAVGGLSSADYRVRNAGRMSESVLSARFNESSGLLLGAIIGVSILVGVIGFWLGIRDEEWSQDVWDRVLSLSLAATLLLRSRVFSRIQHMLAPRIAAVFIALATVNQFAAEYDELGTWLVAAIAGAGAVILGVSILRLSDVTRARVKRYLNWLEFIVVVDLVVVTMGAVALYDWVRG